MPSKSYNCTDCDAIFKIKHDLDQSYYDVVFCPFCGAGLDEEEEEEDDDTY